MKRYHYLYKTITCQTRPADVRLSIRVAATKPHMSTFFFSHHPPPVSPSAPLLMTTTGCNGPNDNIINMLFYRLEHRPTAIKSLVSPTGRTSQVQETSQSARPRTELFKRGGGPRLHYWVLKKEKGKKGLDGRKKNRRRKRSNCKQLSARRDQPGGFISRPISGKKKKKEVKSQEGMQAAASALPQTENK